MSLETYKWSNKPDIMVTVLGIKNTIGSRRTASLVQKERQYQVYYIAYRDTEVPCETYGVNKIILCVINNNYCYHAVIV